MVDNDALLAAFEDFSEALLRPYDIGEMLYRLSDQVVEVLGIDGAGVSLARDGEALAFVTATSRDVAFIVDHQIREAHGPCHDAFDTGEQVRVDDLREQCPWPEFCAVALDRGMRAVASLPMPVGERRIGAMDLYRREAGPWTDGELEVGQVLANMASGYILNNLELSETRNVATQLQHALDSRVVVEQAKGVLAGRMEVSPDEAFATLRQHARSTSRPLHDVCRDVVDGTLDL